MTSPADGDMGTAPGMAQPRIAIHRGHADGAETRGPKWSLPVSADPIPVKVGGSSGYRDGIGREGSGGGASVGSEAGSPVQVYLAGSRGAGRPHGRRAG